MQTSEPTEIQNDPLYRNIFMPNLLDFNLSVLTKINFWVWLSLISNRYQQDQELNLLVNLLVQSSFLTKKI